MSRYEDVDTEALMLVDSVLKDEFPELINSKIGVIFDNRKKSSKGKICLADIQKTNELTRFLSFGETDGEGYDYIMRLDKNVWESIDDNDRIRIIRHELMHCFVDENGSYKTIGHDFEGFHREIEIENQDGGDPRWKDRVSLIAESVYERGD